MMGPPEPESLRLLCPGFADELESDEPTDGIQTLGAGGFEEGHRWPIMGEVKSTQAAMKYRIVSLLTLTCAASIKLNNGL
jgi:hypothetical protein